VPRRPLAYRVLLLCVPPRPLAYGVLLLCGLRRLLASGVLLLCVPCRPLASACAAAVHWQDITIVLLPVTTSCLSMKLHRHAFSFTYSTCVMGSDSSALCLLCCWVKVLLCFTAMAKCEKVWAPA
jgi:hypothetical protein